MSNYNPINDQLLPADFSNSQKFTFIGLFPDEIKLQSSQDICTVYLSETLFWSSLQEWRDWAQLQQTSIIPIATVKQPRTQNYWIRIELWRALFQGLVMCAFGTCFCFCYSSLNSGVRNLKKWSTYFPEGWWSHKYCSISINSNALWQRYKETRFEHSNTCLFWTGTCPKMEIFDKLAHFVLKYWPKQVCYTVTCAKIWTEQQGCYVLRSNWSKCYSTLFCEKNTHFPLRNDKKQSSVSRACPTLYPLCEQCTGFHTDFWAELW
jgi:hypothetical protein